MIVNQKYIEAKDANIKNPVVEGTIVRVAIQGEPGLRIAFNSAFIKNEENENEIVENKDINVTLSTFGLYELDLTQFNNGNDLQILNISIYPPIDKDGLTQDVIIDYITTGEGVMKNVE